MQQDMKKKYKRRKGERKLLLVVDENIVSKSKNDLWKLLIRELSKVCGHKTNTQNSTTFLIKPQEFVTKHKFYRCHL